MTEIKKCPFCGGDAKTSIGYSKASFEQLDICAYVICSKCGVTKRGIMNIIDQPFEKVEGLFERVIEDWNSRV